MVTARGRWIIPAYAGSTSTPAPLTASHRDHPRIRGEHVIGITHVSIWKGSSPHTRGARHGRTARALRRRIIPAYAGSTLGAICPSSTRTDHPRIRGEHVRRAGHARGRQGSSPHTRGAPSREIDVEPVDRIIPAYAGSTLVHAGLTPHIQDHPRIRGEHMSCSTRDNVTAGSSPHTRGARAGSGGVRPDPGIIPAYAGSTSAAAPGEDGAPDHPRIRGEHQKDRSDYEKTHGSSPHTRGAPVVLPVRGPAIGIIPAYAGSTCSPPRNSTTRSDHPRIRGEHGPPMPVNSASSGSSPHTRGALSCRCRGRTSIADHPRIRGEHACGYPNACSGTGSSPHTRGARRHRRALP